MFVYICVYITRYILFMYRKAKDGQRGIISCIAFAPGTLSILVYSECIYVYIHVCICMYVYMYILVYICICRNIYIHIPEGQRRTAWNYLLLRFCSRYAMYTYMFIHICVFGIHIYICIC